LGDNVLFTRSTCSALLITCSDFRFKSAERAFVESAGLVDDYDLIARPGAVRALVSPRDDAARASMEDEIRILHELHGFTRVLLVNHLSCRAYEDLVAGADERAVHRAHLDAAVAALGRRYRGVTLEAYLTDVVDGVLSVQAVDST
jgi:hypothetical protein